MKPPGEAALLLLLLAAPAAAASFASSARGTAGADFLNLGVGGRAMALGGAYCALADEASAVYWNPAAMTRVQRRSLALMHASYISTSYFDYVGYVHNAGKLGVFGLGFQYFTPGQITQTDESGADVGLFAPYDMALTWSYAYRFRDLPHLSFLDGFSVGGSLKLISSRVLQTASAAALDFGALSPPLLGERLRLGFTATNLGGDTLIYNQVKEPLPMAMRAGAAYRLTPRWNASLDAVFPRSDRPYAAAGTEYWFPASGSWSFAARLGFNTQTIGSIDGFTGAAMGFGVGLRGVSADYAFVPLGGLGQAHRLSLTCNF